MTSERQAIKKLAEAVSILLEHTEEVVIANLAVEKALLLVACCDDPGDCNGCT